MADRRFHAYAGALALSRVAEIVEAALPSGADGARTFDDVASLSAAGSAEISFLENRKYLGALAATKAGACLVHPSLAARVPAGCHVLAVANPYLAYARLAAAFHPPQRGPAGVHPTAFVDPSAILGEGIAIGPHAVVMAGAKLGAGVEIGPGASVGANVELGDFAVVGANASISHAVVGPRTRLYPGVRIGQDGFGFATGPGGFVKVPQLGLVRIGADCEVGANSCIDRGSAGDTVIGDGTWIDNLVQIGHNVKTGRSCVIVAQVGISGSTELGDGVMAGGQAGLAGHLKVAAGAKIVAQSGVHRDIDVGQTVGGTPAVPAEEWRRQSAALRRLARRAVSEPPKEPNESA
jgi:UDP-3-O-[3-hydroxymyristoyl] glucosamine N-acyltransferase